MCVEFGLYYDVVKVHRQAQASLSIPLGQKASTDMRSAAQCHSCLIVSDLLHTTAALN